MNNLGHFKEKLIKGLVRTNGAEIVKTACDWWKFAEHEPQQCFSLRAKFPDQSWSGSAKTKAEFSSCAIVWLDLPTILFKIAKYPLSQQHRATKVIRPIIQPWPFHPEAGAQLIGAHISPISEQKPGSFSKALGASRGKHWVKKERTRNCDTRRIKREGTCSLPSSTLCTLLTSTCLLFQVSLRWRHLCPSSTDKKTKAHKVAGCVAGLYYTLQ